MKHIRWAEPNIGDEESAAVAASIESGWVGSNGPMVRQFENAFAEKVGACYAIAVNNGTSALLAALLAFKHKWGIFNVAVPTFTFIASANTVSMVGNIDLIDCDMKTWNIKKDYVPPGYSDLLMTVDVGGLPCDYDSLRDLGTPTIADSAESLGAKYKGKPIGTQADVHCFSFHTAKIITTGEGGMITTDDWNLFTTMRSIVNHGYAFDKKTWEYKHAIEALNFRMTDLEAAVGLVQLKKLDKYVEERRKKAAIYREILGNSVQYQQEPENCFHPYFFFGILIDIDTNIFCEQMLSSGIETKTWTAVHRQRPYAHLRGHWPNADLISKRIVLLPIHNRLGEEDVAHVAKTAKGILETS